MNGRSLPSTFAPSFIASARLVTINSTQSMSRQPPALWGSKCSTISQKKPPSATMSDPTTTNQSSRQNAPVNTQIMNGRKLHRNIRHFCSKIMLRYTGI